MNNINVTVERATENQKGTGFVTKLVASTATKLPGGLGTKISKRTFYISAPEQAEIGSTFELDLDQFEVVQRDTPFADETTGEIIKCKWLHLAV